MEAKEQYPKLCLSYKNTANGTDHCLIFPNENQVEWKHTTQMSVFYSSESLRFAFSRMSVDNICIVTVNNAGVLNVKQLTPNHAYMIESLVFPQTETSDDSDD